MSQQTLDYHLKFGVDEYESASPKQLQFCVDCIAALKTSVRDLEAALKAVREDCLRPHDEGTGKHAQITGRTMRLVDDLLGRSPLETKHE